jgi:putative FmdB family regulatory protein
VGESRTFCGCSGETGMVYEKIRKIALISSEKMPIYEYECLSCGRPFQCLVMKREEEEGLRCPKCGAVRMKRLISRVHYHVSEEDRLAGFDPKAAKEDVFFKDSRNIGLAAKKRARKMGVDLGQGFEEKLEKLRSDPGSVIKDSE